MRAAIYARVSTADQKNAVQIAELKAYAKARGWNLVRIEQDKASGKEATSRPGLAAILELARRRAADVVLVWKLDRFGRSVKDLLANIHELKANGVRFIATTQGIDTDETNPVSRFLMMILAAVAELEREFIRERVAAGVKSAKARGVKFGRPRKVFNRGRIAELRNDGVSIRAIARALGVGATTIHRLLAVPKVELKRPPKTRCKTKKKRPAIGRAKD